MKPLSAILFSLLPLLPLTVAEGGVLCRELPEMQRDTPSQKGEQSVHPKLSIVDSDAFSPELSALVRHLLDRDIDHMPKAPWGELYAWPVQAGDEFLVVLITGYKSGADANMLFVYDFSDKEDDGEFEEEEGEKTETDEDTDWQLHCILDCYDLGPRRVEVSETDSGDMQICATPPLELPYTKYRLLPFVYTFELPEEGNKIPRLHVCPLGVTQVGTPHPDEPESVQVYLRLKMTESLNMYSVSMDTDATADSVSLETSSFSHGEFGEMGVEHIDDVFFGDKPFDSATFLSCAKRVSSFHSLLLPEDAAMPGIIEIGWAYDEETQQWMLLLRHENGQTWSYDFEQHRFLPSELKNIPFAWMI